MTTATASRKWGRTPLQIGPACTTRRGRYILCPAPPLPYKTAHRSGNFHRKDPSTPPAEDSPGDIYGPRTMLPTCGFLAACNDAYLGNVHTLQAELSSRCDPREHENGLCRHPGREYTRARWCLQISSVLPRILRERLHVCGSCPKFAGGSACKR